ncbi:MAG: cob(I)yrinic acid a,c-diamide adenosyltransferase, partial [Candidatus Diapherotrites archaeon]
MAQKDQKLGLIQIYWGNGKGKTTAALGLCCRALGRGLKVHLIQFLKGGIENNKDFEEYGELKTLSKIRNFSYKRFGIKKWVIGKPEKEHIEQAKKALKYAKKIVTKEKYDIVILDEILYALQLGLLKEDEIISLIETKAKNTELILTGSHKPYEKIFEKADLVS